MPGFLVHVGATVTCMHAGQAQPTAPNPRVTVSGMASVTMAAPYVVAACGLTGSPNPPCASAQWTVAATRVTSNGQPLVLFDSQSVCAPTGTPLLVLSTQTRVSAS
jgi:hypothetical protein